MLELSLSDEHGLRKVAHALSSEVRLKVISLLNKGNRNIHQIADSLEIPVSTAASHVKVLEESGLIQTELRPASRGAMKVCTRHYDDIHISLNEQKSFTEEYKSFEFEMPIGQYVDFEVAPTCGMVNQEGFLIPEDEPVHFYRPERSQAQLIWTRKGFFEYRFPLVLPKDVKIEKLQFSLEICSEAPNHDHNWPSDITVWLNNVDIGTWTSPGDFGDRPGKLNPSYWSESTSTQYGTLKTWKLTKEKTMIDDFYLSDVTIDDLAMMNANYLSLKIGIKDDAIHKGGINIFGKEFGDYPQDIKLKIDFS
ncbi:ArsR family transcriptional regulator [Gracilibacillus caseinilyticus]|uniref:ArsR family transcriptional regulator n=1 Tax=Gracilibacillus caseinilyticus TaxID=2932256 RepID=A0ABY4ESF5_9BACI|nr:ArsR family transcriptional regulator [Gracilibacillus caseinilyticus]UOQ46589.1 ArsR family transcriptional regulator [Gracilibacillus caseinilyticus]